MTERARIERFALTLRTKRWGASVGTRKAQKGPADSVETGYGKIQFSFRRPPSGLPNRTVLNKTGAATGYAWCGGRPWPECASQRPTGTVPVTKPGGSTRKAPTDRKGPRVPPACGISGTETELRSEPFIALLADPSYRSGKVPGTCRLRTRVTVKPGARRHLTLEAFRRWVMQAPLQIRNASCEE